MVKLRARGVKLPEAVVKAAEPIHGFMELKYWHLRNQLENRLVRSLVLKYHPQAVSPPLAELADAQQTQLRGDEMVYVGREIFEGEHFAQAWYVRLAPSPTGYGAAGRRAM